MSKKKYCYVIANKENGNLLIRSAELPFFWLREVAKKHCKGFKGYVVHKILLEDIQILVLRSKPLTKTLKPNNP